MGNYYGYTRVSTKEQNLERGCRAIEDWCKQQHINLTQIYVDKLTGKNFDRPRYTVLKEDVLRAGDTLIIPEFDRLGRAGVTKNELNYFKEKGVRVIFLDIPTSQMDLSALDDNMAKMIMTCINDMLISFYDCLSRAELERKQKRQQEGYEAMKARGDWDLLGRPRKMELEDFKKQYQRVLDGKIRSMELMRELGLNQNTYFRYVREVKKEIENK